MTQDEIIEMAIQAGFLTNEIKSYVISPYTFEDQDLYKELEAFAKLVAEKEREACAMLCLWHNNTMSQNPTLFHMAELIRARGEA